MPTATASPTMTRDGADSAASLPDPFPPQPSVPDPNPEPQPPGPQPQPTRPVAGRDDGDDGAGDEEEQADPGGDSDPQPPLAKPGD